MQESQQRVQKLYQISQRQKEFLSESPLNRDGSSFCPGIQSTDAEVASSKWVQQAQETHPEMKGIDPALLQQNPLDNSMVSLISTTRRSRQSRKLRSANASKQGQREDQQPPQEPIQKKEESPIMEDDNENEDCSTVKKPRDSSKQNTSS